MRRVLIGVMAVAVTLAAAAGPDLTGKERRPSTEPPVRLLNGPGNNSKGIRNGVAHELKAGDVVVIPAGTGHQFTKIDDHISYLMVRVDPDKVTPHKTEADSKADLLTDGRGTAGGGAGATPPPPPGRPGNPERNLFLFFYRRF